MFTKPFKRWPVPTKHQGWLWFLSAGQPFAARGLNGAPPLPPAARGAPPAPGAGVLLSRSTGVRSFSSVHSHIRQRRCSTECPPAETPSRASGRRRLPRSRWGRLPWSRWGGLPWSRQGGVGCGRPVQRFRAERNLGENKKSAPRVPGACTRIPRILRLGPRDSPSGSVPGGWGEQGIRLERAGRVPLRRGLRGRLGNARVTALPRTPLPSAETGVRCRHGREHRTHGGGGMREEPRRGAAGPRGRCGSREAAHLDRLALFWKFFVPLY